MRNSLVVASLTLLLFAGTVVSDTYLVQKVHTDGYSVAGATVPASEKQSVIWSTDNKICIDSDKDTSMIMRMDKKLLYVLYKASKKYSEINLADLQKKMEVAKSEVESAAPEGMPAAMAGMMTFDATVKATTESKKIGKWHCTKYNIVMTLPMGVTSTELWSSTDVKIDYANLAKMKNIALSQMPGFAKMMKEFEKVKGFPVSTVTTTNVMGMAIKVKEELVEVAEKAAPAGTYEVPGNYKKIDME